ncbi:MAG TPA: hypothetical protein VKH15_02340 [Candidatus Acidoferrum sp.]|nr:hypothetical protein [Candidatus Acidoferrum sp.]
MKSSLALFTLLLFASCAQAQQHHMMPAMESSQGFGNSGFAGGFGGGFGGSSAAGGGVTYQEPGKFPIGFVKNDGDTAVATFMKYEDALALGKKQIADAELAARGELTPSLGEVARAYRATKVPTLQLQARVTQDNSGNLTICNLNGNNCHRP